MSGVVNSQVQIIEAVARFDAQFSQADHPLGSQGATLSQVEEAFRLETFGRTGEFIVAHRNDDQMIFHFSPRLSNEKQLVIPIDSEFSQHMHLALQGNSGTMVSLDYRGERVLAAYAPIPSLRSGLVGKIDLSELRAPYIKVGGLVMLIAVIAVVITSLLFMRISNQIQKHLKDQNIQLEKENRERKEIELALMEDITQRKATEQQLQNSEERYRSIVDTAVDAIVTIDEKGIITSFNPAATQIFGYDASEMIGQNVSLLMPSPHHEQHDEYINRYLQTRQAKVIGKGREVIGLRKNGETLSLYLSISETMHEGKRQFTGILHDLTHMKSAQLEVQRVSERLDLALRSAHLGVWDWDVTNNNLVWDESMYQLYGIQAEDFGGAYAAWENGVHPEDLERAGNEVQEALELKKEFNTQFRVIWPDGTIRHIRAFAKVVHRDEEDATHMIGVNYDITELIEALEKAEAASKAKTQFLANLTHDIRTPLGAVLGFNKILIDRSKKLDLPDEFLKFQKNVQTSAQNLLEMVNNFLDISKIEAGMMGISEEPIDIKMFIDNIYDTHQILAQQKGVDLSYEINPKIPLTMLSDPTKLVQILSNLIGNALKFTPAGKGVKIKVMGDETNIAFMVIDQGIGIPKSRQQAIFGLYEQANPSTAENYGGTGLGLAITKKLVEMLGGTIRVMSRVKPDHLESGSTFSVTIPYKEAQLPVDHHKPDFDGNFSTEGLILVFEDNPMNQALIKALLDGFGFNLQFANNGKLGLELLENLNVINELPVLIFMDIQMPVMNGIDTTRQIRQIPEYQHIPIVALSADAFTEQQKDALQAGADDYLTKPIDFEKLLRVLNTHL